jgi:hypothetical protein
MPFKIPVQILNQVGTPYEPTEKEKDSIYEHVHCAEYIESNWIKSIVVNAQDLGDRPHTIIVRGYFMNNTDDPFTLSFCAGAPTSLATFSHDALKRRA